MVEKADELTRMTALLECLNQGMDPDSAAKKIFSVHVKFGDPGDGTGDDRPIAIELKRRIGDFMQRQSGNPAVIRQKMERASSFNAIIRAEIRAGNL